MSTISVSGLSAILRSAPSVSLSHTCRETLRVMFQHPESKCIVVCNPSDEPAGLLMSERFFLKATGRKGTGHFYRESVTKLMNRAPLTADIYAPLASLYEEAMRRPDVMKNDCIIITDKGKFTGVVYPSDLRDSICQLP
ncbi:hypothetical protein C2I18_09875 [Paenibacillus sp. PK3_47]|uniref:CBS domain-containing protein n=1 Tax=Paenibacillus sp. PK3_47 TaxID=2072642 RepID=UPI00201DAE0C|nr:CBS domain-containing protein [Paenibacillus sp. PK3_47]UQZ33807.1 hypothetical protein C2I18_09875 [Paenibacillus sp. PK3_47]